MITVIGLGPGCIKDLTLRAWELLSACDTLYLRTRQHPCVPDLPDHLRVISFDDYYEDSQNFEDVYCRIVETLIAAALRGEDVTYAVPGDPSVGEATVTRLRVRAEAEALALEIVNGISFIEPCLKMVGIDALDGIQILDTLEVAAQYHPPINPAQPALLAQIHSQAVASDLKLTLMNQYPDDFEVTLIQGAGTSGESATVLPLYTIDRGPGIGVLTALYVPALHPLSSFEAFQNIIAHLRSEDGCPWDREQTHQSLRPFLIEETYEVLEALDAANPRALSEELGDLLLQIILHSQIAVDDGEFFMADVLKIVSQKMIRRHPHVWGDVEVRGDPDQVTTNWEDIKRAEKADGGQSAGSILDGIPKAAPALLVAHRYSHRAAKVGFDWERIEDVEAKAREEFAEVLAAQAPDDRIAEIGDLIFVLVNWLRWLGVEDPESLLRAVNAKFHRRFSYVEARAAQSGKSLSSFTLDEMEAWWQAAKRAGL